MSEEKDLVPASSNASVFSLQLFDHAQRVAVMLCKSSLIPKDYQGNVQNTMIALEMANRIGASPLMVMQNLYIVHGKPGWSSQFIIATINSCGRFHSLRFDMQGNEGSMDRSCTAWSVEKHVEIPNKIRTLQQAKDAELPILEAPKVDMAIAKAEGWIDKNGSKWKTMPDLMLRYRGAAFWGRLYAPELLMGMQTTEEIVDVQHQVVGEVVQQDEITPEQLQTLLDEKIAFLNKPEFENAKRIIAGKEVESYRKLHTFLTSKTE